MAYEYYSNWLKKGNQDLQLPAFKMTDRQMFWLSLAHVMTNKYQLGVSRTFEIGDQLTNKYMHVLFKSKNKFRKDFKCGKMTTKEKQIFEEFKQKENHIKNVLQLRDVVGHPKYNFDHSFCHFYRLRQTGFYKLLESALKDPRYADDVTEMKETGGVDNKNMARILAHFCPNKKGCYVLS